MLTSNYKWAKTYKLNTKDKIVDFIVWSNINGSFFGTITYWKENYNKKHPPEPQFIVETAQYANLTESGISDKFKEWIDATFKGKNYQIEFKDEYLF